MITEKDPSHSTSVSLKPAIVINDNRKGTTERDHLQTIALAEQLSEPDHDITSIVMSNFWSWDLHHHSYHSNFPSYVADFNA